MLLSKCSYSCATCEIRLQFCIAGANESGRAPNSFVVLLRNAQTDLAIRIWTILLTTRLKKIQKNVFGAFSYNFFVPIRVGLNPCASNLENAARHAEKRVANAVERKKSKHHGSLPATYSFLPLAMTTCGEAGSDVHALIEDLAITRVDHKLFEDTL